MKKFSKWKVLLCGLTAAAVVSVGIASPAGAATAKYVKKIDTVTVDGKTVERGATYKLYYDKDAAKPKMTATVSVKGSASKKVTFTSSKPGVAAIGKTSGKITAKKAGTTTIKVTSKGKKKNGKKATYSVKVKVFTRWIDASVGSSTLTKVTGQADPTTKLKLNLYGLKASTVKVTSSKSGVVAVKKNGNRSYTLTGKKAGKSTIKIVAKSSAAKNAKSFTVKKVISVKEVPVSETLTITDKNTYSGLAIVDITVSDLSAFLTVDIPKLAQAMGITDDEVTVTVGTDTTLKAVYKNGVMTYYRNGVAFTPDANTLNGKSVKSNETVTFPKIASASNIVKGLAGTTFTSGTYDIGFKLNGVAIKATGVKISNGVLTFTTEGVSFKAVAKVSAGKTTMTVTNMTAGSGVAFTSTKLGQAVKTMGICN